MSRTFTPPVECPVCGEVVPRTARACPGCGADERSGWNEEATRYDGLDLPDEAADEPMRRAGVPLWFWPGVGVLTLLAVITAFILR